MSKGELCTSYAAMALYDGEAEITSDQLRTLIEATGNEVEPYWPTLFASLIQKEGIEQLMLSTNTGGSGGAAAASSAAAATAVEEKPAEKVEEPEEEIDMGGGAGLFGEEDGGGDY